ncbi:MAG TPA: aryl-sulfate sulfotransferase [Gemmatimonadales bacterium]|nr:aryl-sulfate sulfotransferase [Gemmatimonadales bacterium]
MTWITPRFLYSSGLLPAHRYVPAAVTVAFAIGCGGDDLAEPIVSKPQVLSASSAANTHNVLSRVIQFRAEHADSARVITLAENAKADTTAYTAVTGGPDTVVVLSLLPGAAYRSVVEAAGTNGPAQSDTIAFTTDPLPDLLQRVSINTAGAGSAGLTLASLPVGGNAVFAIAFDSTGGIRWYRQFEGTEPFAGELKQQTNGNFTLYRGRSTGVEPVPGHFVEFSPAGDSVRAISVNPPRYLDNHELWITSGPDGGERYHFFTYDHRISDLSAIGGADQVSLAGHQLVRLRGDGTTEFEWNGWDRLTIDEWIEPPRPEPGDSTGRDFDHPNGMIIDSDGNYVVSFRHLSQVMKIDALTGETVWRLGGRRNEFTFLNDPLGGFSAQHSPRILPNGNLLLYDNGTSHQPQESRAVEYALDLAARTATLVWEFRHVPPIYTPAVGGVQRLANGNTLVGFGFVGRATEVRPDGSVSWEAEVTVDGRPALVYRPIRIASLYGYQEP